MERDRDPQAHVDETRIVEGERERTRRTLLAGCLGMVGASQAVTLAAVAWSGWRVRQAIEDRPRDVLVLDANRIPVGVFRSNPDYLPDAETWAGHAMAWIEKYRSLPASDKEAAIAEEWLRWRTDEEFAPRLGADLVERNKAINGSPVYARGISAFPDLPLPDDGSATARCEWTEDPESLAHEPMRWRGVISMAYRPRRSTIDLSQNPIGIFTTGFQAFPL